MKTKKIYQNIKQMAKALLETSDDGRQFIESFTGDHYLIDGMPKMRGAEILAFLDVPKRDRELWDVVESGIDEDIVRDYAPDDEDLEIHPIRIVYSGRCLTAYISKSRGVIWLDEEKMAPLPNASYTFLLRTTRTGESYIVVKDGMYTVAALTYEIAQDVAPGETLKTRLMQLAGVET